MTCSPVTIARELPLYDAAGAYRLLVCGNGVFDDGSKSPHMALQAFTDSSWCLVRELNIPQESNVTYMVGVGS